MPPFRFGVVAVPQPDTWLDQARRIADLGYSSLLMPDGVALPSPFPSLAMAAAVTDLTVGTFVLAAPLRPPRSAAWEAHTMTQLTGGRFEFGIGTGLPRTREAAESFGLPFRTTAERLADVELAVTHLRELDGDTRTPVLVAARGPKARALAARLADVVTLAAPALTPRTEVAAMVADLRGRADGRDLELSINLFAVGDGELPPWAAQNLGATVDELVAADSLMLLPGADPRAMADELLRRRDALGISYVKVNSLYLEEMAPVVELLAGR
ncbi:LLM class flavin-dependent oxidoreductase [Pseudonocardia sp.]|uniref:LLM class flavin-dependent oxidoreductase n=1 Tax=Pseudonocardia sp. TaxID=60912 RepID=UPI003D130F9B